MNTIKSSFASLVGDSARIVTGIGDKAITITIEAVDGKSWDQIAGKFGIALDGYVVNKLKIGDVSSLIFKAKTKIFKRSSRRGGCIFNRKNRLFCI